MEFVPLNLGGVFRPLRFVNGLNQNRIRPIVVTIADDEHLRKVQNRFDYALVDKLDKDVKVYRIPLDDISKYYNNRISRFKNTYFNISDNYAKAWRKNLFQQLPGIIEKHRPKAVFVTCPPFSAAGLGVEISKRFGLPLILDMRDAWAKLSMGPLGSYFHYLYKRRAERRAFKQASAIITVTPQLKEIFQRTHPAIPAGKFHLIYNGFDFKLPPSLSVQSESIDEKGSVNIGYVGSFYYHPGARELMLLPWWKKKGHRIFQYTPVKEDWLYRSPYFFLKALATLFVKKPEWRSRVFFHHIGETPEWLDPMAEQLGIRENVVSHGFQTHEKTLEWQESFDLLLATSEKVIDNDHYCLPSKLFTYLRAGRPVVGFVTKGIQRDFIRESRLGVTCDPDDERAASEVMEKIIGEGRRSDLNIPFLLQFANPVAIKELVELISDLVDDGTHIKTNSRINA
jgi:hypothetical protein